MTTANIISIEITTTDKAGLKQLAKTAQQVGKEIETGLGKGLDAAERKAKETGEKSAKSLKDSATKIDKSFDMTARQVGRYLYQIERQAWASGEGMDGAFSESSRKIRADLDKIRTSAAKTGDGLESDLGNALKAVSGQASKLGESIEKPKSGGAGGLLDSLIGDVPKGAAAAGALGLVVGKAAWDGLQQEFAEDRVGGLLAAQTGAASSAAEGLGNTAGDIFTSNFGDSVEQVGEAMKSVFENHLIDTNAAQSDIESVTEKVMTLSQVTGEQFDKISYAAARMVKTGVAGSVSEAFDLIGKAQENGLNAAGDLLDTLTEYDTKFRDLGLTGAEALGLIQQSMEGGARNTDIAADALKEFSIRAQDMSVLTRAGFTAIGMDADVMGHRIAAGGQSAHDALRDTLNALEAMPPGVARNTAAVDLFGTKAEDLGNALYDMNLDGAAKKFGDFGGTVQDQMNKINDSTSFWTKLGKGIDQATGALGEFLDKSTDIELPDSMKSTLEEVNKAQKDFDATGNIQALDDLKKKYPDAADAIDAYIQKKQDEKAATDSTTESGEEYVNTLDKIISKQHEQATGVVDLSEAQIGYQQSLADVNQAIIDNGTNHDISTDKGRKNQEALNSLTGSIWDQITAMQQQSATVEDVQGFMQSARDQFVHTAEGMGYTVAEANALADKLRLIPGDYQANVVANTAAADAAIGRFINTPRTLFIQAKLSGLHGAELAYAGKQAGMAHGGIVGAPWGAQTGGQRHSSTMVDEAGPELIELPSGAQVMTAGATRAMGEAGLLGGGGGGAQVVLSMESSDPLIRAIMQSIRVQVKDYHGGSVTNAFNARGVA